VVARQAAPAEYLAAASAVPEKNTVAVLADYWAAAPDIAASAGALTP